MTPSTRSKRNTLIVSPYFSKKQQETIQIKKEQVDDNKIVIKKEKKEKKNVVLEDNKGVPDILDYDLKVLFVGINPGIMSAARGHHYAGSTNHFWPCLSESGLVDRKVTYQDDIDMATLYQLGFTNLTARTTRSASDLNLAEQRQGIPLLNEKFETYRPRIACFVGKGIYEIYSNKKCKQMGLQQDMVSWSNGEGETLMFVMPSTSGIVTAYQKPDKIRFFQDLNKIIRELYPQSN